MVCRCVVQLAWDLRWRYGAEKHPEPLTFLAFAMESQPTAAFGMGCAIKTRFGFSLVRCHSPCRNGHFCSAQEFVLQAATYVAFGASSARQKYSLGFYLINSYNMQQMSLAFEHLVCTPTRRRRMFRQIDLPPKQQ